MVCLLKPFITTKLNESIKRIPLFCKVNIVVLLFRCYCDYYEQLSVYVFKSLTRKRQLRLGY
jgi:hypothetical protein